MWLPFLNWLVEIMRDGRVARAAVATYDGRMPDGGGDPGERLTFLQRRTLKGVVKQARKRPGEPLSPDDWAAYFEFASQPSTRVMKRLLRALPSHPRCGFCGAPFAGVGSRIVGPLGYRPSRKNPSICDACIEAAPPGGMTTDAGVLFADLRGFTTLSESMSPEATSVLLRRFYSSAEKVLLPGALIDKLIGDEVMALYIPALVQVTAKATDAAGDIPSLMLAHARELLVHVGYGTPEGPFAELGIGLDYGEAFIGHIGDGSVHDFTAVGDVVNTAARLQGQARGGEVVVSERLARHLAQPPGVAESVVVKGKAEAVAARRISWFPPAG